MTFDEQEAQEYDDFFTTKLGKFVDEVETELAFKLFQPEPNSKVLDVGCGTGNFSIKLAQKGYKVVGIDISQPMLKKARNKLRKTEKNLDIEFRHMDALELDFPDSCFDHAFSMATVEFIPDDKKEKFIKEMLRVVKPGGKILVGTITKDSNWGQMYQQQAQSEESVFKDAEFTTPESLNQIEVDKLVTSEECLFISPTAEGEEISWEREKQLSDKKRGGFFCSLWQKPKM